MKRYLVFLILILSLTELKAQNTSLIKVYGDKSQSTISYAMRHPLHSWDGVSKDISSVILCNKDKTEISQVAVSVKIASFDSQNANRDSHAMEVTEALLYPSITFTSNSIKTIDNQFEVKGIITFHGKSQNVSFLANKEIIDQKIKITGGFTVKLTQFGIEPPSLMGISTDDEMTIRFSVLY